VSWGQFSLSDIGGILSRVRSRSTGTPAGLFPYLVGFMSSSSSGLALLAGCEFGEISVVVALPVHSVRSCDCIRLAMCLHLVVEDLGLASLGLGDQSFVEDIEDVLADFLELCFDLLTVVSDGSDVLVRAFGFLLLFNA